jgi:hypothetical protein
VKGFPRYRGDPSESEKLLCYYYEIQKDCETFTVDSRNAISAYKTYAYAGGGHSTVRLALIENPEQIFTGILIYYNFGNLEEISVNSKEANEAYLLDVRKRIEDGETSPKDQENLEIFERILSTFRFIK